MKREDILQVDALKAELSDAFRSFERRLTGVFGELVYSLDTVIEKYNAQEQRAEQLQAQLDTVAARLLAIERRLGPEH